MKKQLLCIIAIIFSLQFAVAQTGFAPMNATWHHHFYRGTYVTTVTDDTVILGVTCSILKQKVYIKKDGSLGAREKGSRDLYLYELRDTVFVFNDFYNKFTPLYVFNVAAGDTVRLPLVPVANSCTWVDKPNTIFAFIVDSVKEVTYDGVPLKTVFSHPLSEDGKGTMSWNGGIDNKRISVYAKKLGALRFGFLPSCSRTCTTIAIDGCNSADTLLCYSEHPLTIKLADSCFTADLIPAGISQQNILSAKLTIQPNPTADIVYIRGYKPHNTIECSVYNNLGQVLLLQRFRETDHLALDVSKFSPGFYFVRLYDLSDHAVQTAKFIKE